MLDCLVLSFFLVWSVLSCQPSPFPFSFCLPWFLVEFSFLLSFGVVSVVLYLCVSCVSCRVCHPSFCFLHLYSKILTWSRVLVSFLVFCPARILAMPELPAAPSPSFAGTRVELSRREESFLSRRRLISSPSEDGLRHSSVFLFVRRPELRALQPKRYGRAASVRHWLLLLSHSASNMKFRNRIPEIVIL